MSLIPVCLNFLKKRDMKPVSLSIAIALLFSVLNQTICQDMGTLSIDSGPESEEMLDLMAFQGINYEKVKIKAPGIKGKDYHITLKEFEGGALKRSDVIFDSSRDVFFKIKADSLDFKVLTQVDASGFFNLMVNFKRFSISEKYSLPEHKTGDYVLKNFLGSKDEIPFKIKGSNYLLVYMTPFVHGDGSASYCEVAQSGVNPEQLFEKFKIPHYYLIELTIK